MLYPSLATASNRHQHVFEVCECQFPPEIGAYKHLQVVEARFTLFRHIPQNPIIVREILAERKGTNYRIITLVTSTKNSSVGRDGPVIEIVKLNGPYWPGKIIYQLSLAQINLAYNKLNED